MNAPRTIGVVINDLFRGGAQRIVADLVLHGNANKYRYDIYHFNATESGSGDSTWEKALSEAGARIIHIKTTNGFSAIRQLVQHLRASRPLLVLTYLPYASILGRIAALLARLPVISVQCNLPFTYPLRIRLLDALTLPLTSAWVGATSGIEAAYGGTAKRFSPAAWEEGRRHFTIYGAVDVDAVAAAAARVDRRTKRQELNVPLGVPLLMMTARLVSWKGHADLIDAMPFIPQAHVLLIGWGTLEESLRDRAHERGVSDRVHFLLQRPDVYELLGIADCYVQTHQMENGRIWMGPNLSQIEACAAGVPSVSTAVPFIEELIEEGKTGYLARINDPEDLARAIRDALHNTEESRTMATAAAGRVRAHFSTAAMVASYEGIYDHFL